MWAILPVTLFAVFVQGLDAGEIGEGVKGSAPAPLPLNYSAETLFLSEAGWDGLWDPRRALVLLSASRPASVTASYGPLSAEAPVPPGPLPPGSGPALGRRLRPFVLARRVLSSAPRVRVLFHVGWGQDGGGGAGGGARGRGQEEEEEELCVTVYGFSEQQETRGACSLQGVSGYCVAELEPPDAWFRPLGGASSSERRDRKEAGSGAGTVELYYRARPAGRPGRCAPEGRAEGSHAAVAPMKRMGGVRLVKVPPGPAPLSRLRLGGGVVVQTSSEPVKAADLATFVVSVSSASPLSLFTLRATVKKGLSFSTARPRNSHLWDSTLQPGSGSQLGTISVTFRRKSPVPGKRSESGLLELLLLDFQTEELSSQSQKHEVTWQLELPGGQRRGEQGIMRIYTMPNDYVGLAPLVMDSELLNTAVLTGKPVSVAVRTVAVATDGSVTDVSNVTSCRSADEDVLKVSERCDYVFVNGKETKGRVGVAVNFTYGPLSARLEMSVWMPRLPLQIELADPELSQIKGWRVPVPAAGKRSSWESEEEEERKGKGCTLQFQHSLVKVLAPFLAEQPGPRLPPAPFLGPDWRVDVTELVRSSLRVENPRVARLQAGRVLLGRGVGVTSIKVLSPLSDSVLGERTVKVLDDRVSIAELGVQLVSGLSLSLQLSPGSNRAIVATATTQEALHSPKQEAVIGCWLQFSDGSLAPLQAYDPGSYTLSVTSLDSGVVSVRGSPAVAVAEGEGQGALVRAEMGIAEACLKSGRRSSLATGRGSLWVAFRALDGGGGGGWERIEPGTTPPPAQTWANPTEAGGRYAASSPPPGFDDGKSSGTVGTGPDVVVGGTVGAAANLGGAGSSGSEGPNQTGVGAGRGPVGVGGVPGGVASIPGGVDSVGSGVGSVRGGVGSVRGGVGSVRGGVDSIRGGVGSVEGGVDSVLGGVVVGGRVYGGGAVGVGGAGANTSDRWDVVPSRAEVPGRPPTEVETDALSRFPGNLEIGMYALLGVLCLAILVFLLNCVSYLTGARRKKPPAHCQEPMGGHRHDWVWLGAEADLATAPPALAVSVLAPPGAVAVGRSATLGRRRPGAPSADALLGRRGSLQARPTIHSPTSKRKRVQFTTFSSLDSPHYATLPGMHWATKVQEFASQQGAAPEALYANVSYEHSPITQ